MLYLAFAAVGGLLGGIVALVSDSGVIPVLVGIFFGEMLALAYSHR